jgi:ABC-2 type transport system permease protein
MSAIYILWLRQVIRFFRSRARLIGSLGQPLLFLLAFGFGLGPMFAKSGGGNYIQFLTPGVIAMTILFTSIGAGIEVIWDKQFGFLKETLVAPVSRLKIMFGRTLGGATVAVFQGIIILALSFIIGFRPVSYPMLLLSLVFMFLTALAFTALGTAIGSYLEDMHAFQLIMNFLIMPLFFLSGALFPLDNLPTAIDVLTHINPLTYGVDGLRATMINVSHFSIATNLIVLSIITAFFIVLGSYTFSKMQA